MGKPLGIIFFDIDDTLFDSTRFVDYAREQSFKNMIEEGLAVSMGKLKELFSQAYISQGSNASNHYNIVLENLGLSRLEIDRFVAIAVVTYHRAKREIQDYMHKDVNKVLKHLSKDYVLGIISSGIGVKQWDKLYRLDIDHYFDVRDVYITLSINHDKDIPLYKGLYDYYKSHYDDNFKVVMIGDREDSDIAPAKQAGYETIRFRSNGKYNGDYKNSNADHKVEQLKDIIDKNIL